MNRRVRLRNVFLLVAIIAIIMSVGGERIAMAGMMDSIKEFLWGREYPITKVKGRILFTSNREGKPNDKDISYGCHILKEGKIEKVWAGAIACSWDSDGELILVETKSPIENDGYVLESINGKTGVAKLIFRGNEFEKETGLFILNPYLSPAGEKIYFEAFNSTKNAETKATNAYSLDLNGKTLRQLTFLKKKNANVNDFDLSPDEQRIAFTSKADWGEMNSKAAVYWANTDGSGLTKLTAKGLIEHGPKWSPDGQSIAYVSKKIGEYSQIMIMDKNGENRRQITTSKFDKENICWSPDGKMLCYEGFTHGSPFAYSELFVVNIDGTGEARLMEAAHFGRVWATDRRPDWIK